MAYKSHVSTSERDQIGVLFASGVSQRNIARKLNRGFPSINYEIRKNSQGGVYQPILAQYLSKERNLKGREENLREYLQSSQEKILQTQQEVLREMQPAYT